MKSYNFNPAQESANINWPLSQNYEDIGCQRQSA